VNAPPVRQMQQAYDDLDRELADLRHEHNDLAIEHKRLAEIVANPRIPTVDRLVAEKDIEAVVKAGHVVSQRQQQLADEMSRITRDLAPAKAALREAQRTLAYIAELKGDEPDAIRFGMGQIRVEEKRLKTLVKAMEA